MTKPKGTPIIRRDGYIEAGALERATVDRDGFLVLDPINVKRIHPRDQKVRITVILLDRKEAAR